MTRVRWRGVVVDKRTAAMLDELAALTGDVYVRPTQGSYNAGGVAASAGTHDAGGAVDIAAAQLAPSARAVIVREARRVGFAAWLRTPAQSSWPFHIHAIAVQPGGKPDRGILSFGAHQQVIDYYENRNGLASRAPDDGPRDFVGVTFETYQETTMALSDDDVERIARATAARVNRTLGDYTADGKPAGPNKDNPQLAANYIRQIRRLVDKIADR